MSEIIEGRKILKKRKVKSWGLYIVLAELDPKVSCEKYVTWYYNEQSGGFSSGSYFNDLTRAEKNFSERVAKELD